MEEVELPTILEIVQTDDGEFDLLEGALLAAAPDLVDVAGDATAGPVTVLAPNDQAFINLAGDLGFEVDEETALATLAAVSELVSPFDNATALLELILDYHVLPGALTVEDIAASDNLDNLAGVSLVPVETDTIDFIDIAGISNPQIGALSDVEASNGIVQEITEVLLPFEVGLLTGAEGVSKFGGGIDVVVGSELGDTVGLGRGDDLFGDTGGDDVVNGGRGEDNVNAGAGEDEVRGGGGMDTISGGDDDDVLRGNKGMDSLFGNDGDDEVRGSRGDDVVFGGDGDDIVRGGKGDDTLIGGSGDDTLTGHNGSDVFVFNPTNFIEGEIEDIQFEGDDVVTDFDASEDRILLDLSSLDEETIDAVASENDPDTLELADLVTAGLLGVADSDGDLLVTHSAGTILFQGVPSDVSLEVLASVIDFDAEGQFVDESDNPLGDIL